MKNSLVEKLKSAGKKALNFGKQSLPYLGAGALITYLSTQDAASQNKSNVYPDSHISNVDFEKLNNGKPLWTTEVGLWENLMRGYFHEFPEHAENQKGFMFLPHDSVTVWKGYNKRGNNELEFNTYYTFEKVKDGNKSADEFTFAVDGEHAVKITRDLGRLCNDQALEEGIKRGYDKDGYTVETVYELGGVLKVLRINDEYFLYPYKENEEFEEIRKSIKDGKTPEKTPGYLIKLDKNTQIGVENKTGALKIRSPNNIYEGVMHFTGEETVHRETTSTGGQAGKKPKASKGEDDKSTDEVTSTPVKDKKNLYLIFGANGNEKFWEGNLGIQYGPVAFVGNYGLGKDEVTLEGTTDPSPMTGRYVDVKEWNQDMKLIGISGEIHPLSNKKVSPFIGGGINKWDYTENKSMTMFGRSGQPLGSNSESKANSELSYKAKTGINFKVGEKSQIGVQGNYDTKAKFSGGVRFTRKF